jgi:hypothetical protein
MEQQTLKEELTLRVSTVWLNITTWRGMSFGAVHWYGNLEVEAFDGINWDKQLRPIELRRTLTASQARDLTKVQNYNTMFDWNIKYVKGDTTNCFDEEEDVIKFAIKEYKKYYPNATRLVLGSTVYDEPIRTLHEVK